MSRYIDAEKFEKAIIGMAYVGNKGKIVFDTDFIFNTLYQQPTADVQEVKHGKWEFNSDSPECAFCSICGDGVTDDSEYCPWCGAKMDKGEQE